MTDALAKDRGIELGRTLIGFKYAGERIGLLEAADEEGRFLFGFEESYGYLAGFYVRDKDAMVVAMLVCQAAAWHRAASRDLVESMEALCERYGHRGTSLLSVAYPGAEGAARMTSIVSGLREDPPAKVAGLAVEGAVDYLPGVPMPVANGREGDPIQELPPADVLGLRLAGGAKAIVRPSGTELKIKAYVSACGKNAQSADAELEELAAAMRELLGQGRLRGVGRLESGIKTLE